jgi:NAD(P)H-flavin reductase
LVAAGTGITPCYQIIQSVANEWESYEMYQMHKQQHPDEQVLQVMELEPPKVWLVYANRSKNDVLLAKELRGLEMKHRFWLKMTHVLSREESTGGGGYLNGAEVLGGRVEFGRVDEEILRRCLAGPEVGKVGGDGDHDEDIDERVGSSLSTPRTFKKRAVFDVSEDEDEEDDEEDGTRRSELSKRSDIEDEGSAVFICGSDAFVKETCVPVLVDKIGFEGHDIFVF